MGIFDLFSSDNEKAAAAAKTAGLNAGYSQASDLFGQGRDAATTQAGTAQGFYAPLNATLQTGQKGYDAYADAAGANGADGLSRANGLFQQTPGYATGLSSGLDALDRRAASRGMLSSGNNEQDTLKFANDYANTKYGSYLQGLSPYATALPGQELGAAAGQAGIASGLGSTLNSSFGNQGLLGYQTQAGIGNANAAYETSKDQTGANILGAIGKGVGLASQLAGFL